MEGGKALFTIVLIMGHHLSLLQKTVCSHHHNHHHYYILLLPAAPAAPAPAPPSPPTHRPSPITPQNFAMLPGAQLQQCHEQGTSAHHLPRWHAAGPVSTKRYIMSPTSVSILLHPGSSTAPLYSLLERNVFEGALINDGFWQGLQIFGLRTIVTVIFPSDGPNQRYVGQELPHYHQLWKRYTIKTLR